MRRNQTIPIAVARRREIAARHLLDVRTLDRALREGPEAVRAGMTRDRVIAALADLEIAAPEVRERRASR